MSTPKHNVDETPDPFIDCDAWCHTENVEWPLPSSYTYVWTIKKFGARKDKTTGSIESSEFDVPIPNNASLVANEWTLHLKFGNDSLFIKLNYNGGICDLKAKYKLSIVNSKKSRQNFIYSNGIESMSYTLESSGYKKFIDKSNLIGDLLPDDCLHIACDIIVFSAELCLEWKKKGAAKESDDNARMYEKQVCLDLQEAYAKNEACDSDVVVNCGGKVFNCHKFILKARSPVFNAMFKTNMKEGKSGEINVDNHDPNVFADMLHFIYTGRIPINDKLSKDLLIAANYYQLEQLKTACEENLCKTLGRNNCIGFLFFADTYSVKVLRKRSLEMAAKNLSALMKSSEWNEDLSKYPLLKDEIIECAMSLKVDQWRRA